MKRIVLLSDTHSYCEPKLEVHLKEADEIWHAGDIGNMQVVEWLQSFGKPFRAVFGNIDSKELRNEFLEDLFFTIEGIDVYITHIGGYPGRYSSHAKHFLEEKKTIDLFICGHSHILKMEKDSKYQHWVFNPGAAGREGFHKVKTALKFEIDERNITKIDIINLGAR